MSTYEKSVILKIVRLEEESLYSKYRFIDMEGRTYFLSNKEDKKILPYLNVGDIYIGWVIREAGTFGFIRVTVNDMLIEDYIDSIPGLKVNDYLALLDYVDDKLYLGFSIMRNDKNFNLEKEKNETLLKYSKETIEYFKRKGYNSKEEKDVMNIAIVNNYIYDRYKDCLKNIER